MRDELGRNVSGGTKRGVIKCFQILADGMVRIIRINRLRVPILLRRGLLTVGVSGENTGISCISLSSRQSGFDALRNYGFKHVAQHITIVEPPVQSPAGHLQSKSAERGGSWRTSSDPELGPSDQVCRTSDTQGSSGHPRQSFLTKILSLEAVKRSGKMNNSH